MAYVFNNINSMMGQEPDQSNIFGQGGQDAAGQQDQSNLSTTQAPASSKPQPSGASPQASSTNAQKAQAMVNDQSIINKNQSANPQLSQNFKAQEGDIGSKLQNEANSYLGSQKALGDQNAMHAGEEETALWNGDYGTIASKLNAGPAAAGSFNSSVNTAVPNLDALKSQSGLQGLFFNQGNETYGKGLAALDASILGQNQNFKQQRGELFSGQQSLRDQQAQNNQTLQSQAQQQINAENELNKQGIRNYAQNFEDQISAREEARAQQQNAALQALQSAGAQHQFLDPQTAAVRQQYLQSLGVEGPGSQDKINILQSLGALPNETQYINYAAPVSGRGVMTQDEANRFNSINALLGKGGEVYTGQNQAPQQSFNSSGYLEALKGMVGQKYQEKLAQDAAAEAERQRLAVKSAGGGNTFGSGAIIPDIFNAPQTPGLSGGPGNTGNVGVYEAARAAKWATQNPDLNVPTSVSGNGLF